MTVTIASYLRPSDMARAPIALEMASLIGNQGHISSVAVGATSLPLVETLAVALPLQSRVVIFDGISTEIAIVTVAASVGASSLTVTALQYAHATNTEYLTDGTSGSLADVLLRASARVENECRQSLLLQAYTDVTRLLVSAKNVRRDGGLKIEPVHYPVASVTSLSLQYDNVVAPAVVVDVTTLITNTVKWTLLLPYLALVQAAVLYSDDDYEGMASFGGGKGFIATMVYQAGFPFSAIPYDLQEAALLFACVELGQRQNPTGAELVAMGKRKVQYLGNSDLSGLLLFEKRALKILADSYTKQGHVR